jgi:hypothetical protein
MRSKPWTGKDVCAELPNVFRRLPEVPLFSPRWGVTTPARGLRKRSLDPTILLNATSAVLGPTSTERRHFLAWARIRGVGSNKEWSEYAEANRATLKSDSTFKRNRIKWCDLVAIEVNKRLGFSGGNDTGCDCCAA